MADLTSTYMGIKLKNPVIAGASELTSNMNSIKKIEDSGAGALVIKSLFEEQIQIERARFEEEQSVYSDFNAEMGSLYPNLEHSGPEEHLMWVRKAKESVDIPVIASLNAVNRETWVEWALKLQDTGVDGLEFNFFANPEKQAGQSAQVEKEQVAVIDAVVKTVSIPVSIKLSLFYTTPVTVCKAFAQAGAKGLVLFNRFFEPDIDIESESHITPFNLSNPTDGRISMRYTGLLFGNIATSLCASNGISDGSDVIKMILAGADTVQVVSSLYRNKVHYLGQIIKDLNDWMDGKGYKTLKDFRGKSSKKNTSDPWAYKRAQYVKLLMKPDPLEFS